MKKALLLSLFAFIFVACSNSIEDEIVKKYETRVNEFSNSYKEWFIKDKKELEISNFVCKNDSSFILCENDGFKLYSSDIFQDYKQAPLLQANKISLRFNEVYTGKKEGEISYKQYIEDMFKNKKKLKHTINISGLKIGDEVANLLTDSVSTGDESLNSLLANFIKDEYKWQGDIIMSRQNDGIKIIYDYALIGLKGPLKANINSSAVFKNAGLDWFDKINLKFNTDAIELNDNINLKLATMFFSPQEVQDPQALVSLLESLSYIHLLDTKLNISFDSKNALKSYVAAIKSTISSIILHGDDARLNTSMKNILNLVDSITEKPVYKLNLNMVFGDVNLDTLAKDPFKYMAITINGKNVLNDINTLWLFVADNLIPYTDFDF
ncbi:MULTISPECIES: JlpA family lipoprotein adhesin [unclassified Campylobacter]|uniref:JlpA family lipoprotein adhesin n=1 Tax=unclassified Campylobacter TaxID=2593542 RepID=UPI0012380F30|nr:MULTISPECIES: JlpA family lipoprotein adhesin [unclassified Campylobacter]KAA6226718.1 hypothetical protein FMM55_03985 [Campylobacter sp. LR196d]KAA6228686.1 hypothetical protein FMM54_00510 [Campylobacter sp. LR185c]KAA6229089.1 hypothetical protein FMM57_01690 [Campylobacter sp. LR286c]KAA6230155.1 hypothetical protein FMM58_05615 [Campylobacter sp. LR291e]KAA6233676.1 hypothetical protein FMM56_01830 [Campylobacter sp. LR264d]